MQQLISFIKEQASTINFSDIRLRDAKNVTIYPNGTLHADHVGQYREGKLVLLNADDVDSNDHVTASWAESAIIDTTTVATSISNFDYNKVDTFLVNSADLVIIDGRYYADIGSIRIEV